MAAALALGERGRGRTGSNPNVGCIVTRTGRLIARGWTQPGGRPHAEAHALSRIEGSLERATVYVTLEPCVHESERGPACADLLVAARPAHVVIAAHDADPRTEGKGIARLQDAGIAVTHGVMAAEAHRGMAGFFTRQRHGRPHVTLKLATSLDGRIACADGSSRWITGEPARRHAHGLRARSDAILVGGGTLRADEPSLDVRLDGLEERSPERLVLTRGDAPDGWTAIDQPEAIASLPANWLLVEGGAETAAAFLRADMVDRLILYRAPILIGDGRAALGDIGLGALADAHGRWSLADTRMLGSDRLDVYERH
ncbi:bifunctional diaminohydroxyphosphoribosylaminopyrimidine deaminase/5-amino-6-(5-phosphoribosylamino)uracil reductase RibD [Novosphingopyxis sp.]|uniref:bifunctional diaminohydroxyphosphoribosylaminopyrimidine deaminase/5-amino-6-(5-phosphoribosylamino)uracil reductase RibD n=1 Tax=Novosphingopyxis sp. TaxID=2709690 RepID=UPI003B595333